MSRIMDRTAAVVVLFFFSSSLAFSATSAYERLAMVNDSLDKIESSALRTDKVADSSSQTAQTTSPKKSAIAYQYGQQLGATSQQAAISSGSAVSDGWQKAFKIKGEVRLGLGVEEGDVIWRKADGNLYERNWRLLDDKALNRTENTFDPAVYSRLKVELDAVIEQSVRMHLNVTLDPWSYTGKSQVVKGTGTWGDQINVQYLTWGNTGYTLGRIYNGTLLGDSTTIGEVKVKDGKVSATTVLGAWKNQWNQHETFTVPEASFNYTFNPLRELWFDFKAGDKGYVRVFPMAYEDQALTSDDPLHLSNNKTYWEESPWVRDWTSGNLNTTATPVSFTKGKWDRAIANMSRDSDGTWLTALRGVSLNMKTNEEGTIKAVVATPKTLWQEYGDLTAIPGSVRLKQFFADRLFVGLTGNMHLGIVNNHQVDAENYAESIDAGALPLDGVKITAEASASSSTNDETSSAYKTHKRGSAFYAAVQLFSAGDDVLNKDYFGLTPAKGTPTFAKTQFYFGRMEKNFESSLSNYHKTRDDSFWSRHLTFYPSPYRNLPGTAPTLSHYDLEPFAIGNGLDYGRRVIGWRGDISLLEDRLKGLGDTRYVMSDDAPNKKIEAVSRTEWEYQATDKLLTKMLLLHQGMPKTTAGKDPFVIDGDTGLPVNNDAVLGGQDPSLNTGTLGLRYQATDWLALNGVWERTNDFTVGANNYPNWIMNNAFNEVYTDNGRVYNRAAPFLYDQEYLDQAPYAYHNIVKTGIELKPADKWDLYLDYTRNPNKFAGNIDDNSNHIGAEASYVPNEKWGFFTRYTFSRMYDMDRLVNDHVLHYQTYHNLYFETRYCHTKDSKLSLLYGVGPTYNIGVQGINPSLAYYSSASVDTQHIIRLIYQQKF